MHLLCSDDMKLFLIFGKVLGLLGIASFMFAGFLAYRASPPRKTFTQYPVRTRLLMGLPFNKSWQNAVAPEHIEAIQEHRRIFFVMQLVFFSIAAINFTYFVILGHQLFLMVASGQCQG